MNTLRQDLKIIEQWIKPNSQILDLGCGDGELLKHLKDSKGVRGYGLEIDHEKITRCIAQGLNVIEQDLDKGLKNFKNDSMSTVIMTQALQAVERPDLMIDEMLRIGEEAIVTFPNFGYWRTRFYLMLKGRMPMSKTIPYNWYDSPNIHFCTFRDFEVLCHEKRIRILDKTVLDGEYNEHFGMKVWPSLLGEIAIYRIKRK